MAAELSAIDMALSKMYHSEKTEDEIFVFTDSLSSIQLLQTNPYPTHIQLQLTMVLNLVINLKSAGVSVICVGS
jgi:hypothetical protein